MAPVAPSGYATAPAGPLMGLHAVKPASDYKLIRRFVCQDDVVVVAVTSDYRLERSD